MPRMRKLGDVPYLNFGLYHHSEIGIAAHKLGNFKTPINGLPIELMLTHLYIIIHSVITI